MRQFILLLSLALFSCFGLPHYQYTTKTPNFTQKTIGVMIDKSFNFQDQLSIDNALNEWNYSLNGLIQLRVVSNEFDMLPDQIETAKEDNDLLILKIDGSASFIPKTNPDNQVLAFTHTHASLIYVVRERLKTRSLKAVVLHELGHFLGSEHTKDSGYLMSPVYDERFQQCVDFDSAFSVSIAQHLDIEQMNYCTYD